MDASAASLSSRSVWFTRKKIRNAASPAPSAHGSRSANAFCPKILNEPAVIQ